jgi:hypothetical protein
MCFIWLACVQVSVLLAEDTKVFLVDIRPEEAREAEGLPELKLQARFKVAAFPLQVRQAVTAAAAVTGLPDTAGEATA